MRKRRNLKKGFYKVVGEGKVGEHIRARKSRKLSPPLVCGDKESVWLLGSGQS